MARVDFFRVKQAARLLFCSNSAVTDGTEVDWDDIHKFLHIIHGWSQIVKARPSWRIGQKIMFMLFHGSKANILFIDHIAR